MIFGIFRISGHSMMPNFLPGDRVIASSLPYFFKNPRKNDVIVFRYNKKMLIKRIIRIQNEKYFVMGDNKKDSLKVGALKKNEILGKVIHVLMY